MNKINKTKIIILCLACLTTLYIIFGLPNFYQVFGFVALLGLIDMITGFGDKILKKVLIQ